MLNIKAFPQLWKRQTAEQTAELVGHYNTFPSQQRFWS